MACKGLGNQTPPILVAPPDEQITKSRAASSFFVFLPIYVNLYLFVLIIAPKILCQQGRCDWWYFTSLGSLSEQLFDIIVGCRSLIYF